MCGRKEGCGRSSGSQPLASPPGGHSAALAAGRGEGRSKKLLNSPPGRPSAAQVLLGTAEPSCSVQRCFLPTWVPAQVRTGRSDRALAEGAGAASAPTAPEAVAHGHTDSGEDHHTAAPSGNFFWGGNKQSQFNSCYFGEHRPMWGVVHAATASIPHCLLGFLSLGPQQRASFQLQSLVSLPFQAHGSPFLCIRTSCSSAGVFMVNLGCHRPLPLPEPPSKLERVGEHVGQGHRTCPCQRSCPHPLPPRWSRKRSEPARGDQLGQMPAFDLAR